MVTVTMQAKDRLFEIRENASVSQDSVGLRLVPSLDGTLGLRADVRRADDAVVEHRGAPVLLIGSRVSGLVANKTLDCKTTASGPKLVLRPFKGRSR